MKVAELGAAEMGVAEMLALLSRSFRMRQPTTRRESLFEGFLQKVHHVSRPSGHSNRQQFLSHGASETLLLPLLPLLPLLLLLPSLLPVPVLPPWATGRRSCAPLASAAAPSPRTTNTACGRSGTRCVW